MIVQERYQPTAIAANGSYTLTGTALGGFISVTGGTLTVTRNDGVVLLNALPLVAGTYYPLPFHLGSDGNSGGTLTLAGGASGTILV